MSVKLFIIGVYFLVLMLACFLGYKRKNTHFLHGILIVLCLCLIVIAALRSDMWNDTRAYYMSFRYYIRSITEAPLVDYDTRYYADKGFMVLSAIVKALTTQRIIYFGVISAVTISMLYVDLRKYCLVPLMGLLIYVARFYMSRDLMQIRAGVAIVVVVYSIIYIERRELWKFLVCIFIAWSLHHSMIFALPVYFMRMININKKMIFISLAIAFAVAATLSAVIFSSVAEYSAEYEIGEAYTDKHSGYTTGLGLMNPMIYYQTFVLLAFTLMERRLKQTVPYYITLRDGYLYSTLALILLSPFLVLAGRISTILATLEILILPALPLGVSKKYRPFAIAGVAIVAFGFFYLNFSSAASRI